MSSILTEDSTILIFAYAPVGFGHLRVTDSLYHGLPKDITPVLLGSQDQSISNLYRFVSIHPITRMIMEAAQSGIGEDIFAYYYMYFLRSHVQLLYQQLITILEQRIEIPKTIIIIATHFGLAHQFAGIKERIEKERNIKIILIVQITDDSPQKLWYVPGADIIFSPSQATAHELNIRVKHIDMQPVHIIVNAYPIHPLLAHVLSDSDHTNRIEQVDPKSNSKRHIIIPLSGAAVGTSFYLELISSLVKTNNNFLFHVIAKSAPYTQNFLQKILAMPSVDLHVSISDREVVNMYEEAYLREIIAIEVTKPSEQAFKAVLNPRRRGGSLLLFVEPVGKQEFDNLEFLKRHGLIPTPHEQKALWDKSEKQHVLSHDDDLYKKSAHWRGMLLSNNPQKASHFIDWVLKSNLLSQMVHKKEDATTNPELSPYGVEEFWQKVREFLEKGKA